MITNELTLANLEKAVEVMNKLHLEHIREEKNDMAKGPLITAGIEALIASVYQNHFEWKAPVVRDEVDYFLHKVNPNLPTGWPSLSDVLKVVTTLHRNKPDPQENPWSIATVDIYPIPPEAIRAVLNVWKFRKDSKERKFSSRFTIREAKWVARLSTLITDTKGLSAKAHQYASTELLYKMIDRPFDSEELDSLLNEIDETTRGDEINATK